MFNGRSHDTPAAEDFHPFSALYAAGPVTSCSEGVLACESRRRPAAQVRTRPGETPGQPAGEDACATLPIALLPRGRRFGTRLTAGDAVRMIRA